MEKKIILLLSILIMLNSNVFSEEATQPLKLTIETDKEVYFVGDVIKVIYTIKNISRRPVSFFYSSDSLHFQIIIADGREYEDLGYVYQTWMPEIEYKVLQPNEEWVREEVFAKIHEGKVHKMISGGKGKGAGPIEEVLYYDGFYISLDNWINRLIKDGYGLYNLSLQYCGLTRLDCVGCPPFFYDRDCVDINSFREGYEERFKEGYKNMDDADRAWEWRKSFLSSDIEQAKIYCDKLTLLKDAWQDCLESNIIKIQIVEKEE
ncbi:MAG: hypothetical protein ABH954_06000 [Candidatus Omnitrophota bacterium]